MKNKYTFVGEQHITASFVSGEFIWIAFLGVSSVCSLYKSSVYNPNLRYWDINVTADEIKYMIEDATYLYLALDHSTYMGAKVSKTNPSSITYFTKQESIIEEAVDLINDGTYTYFLIPGIESGENTKICKYNTSTRAFVETIDLNDVFNAKKIDIDNDDNLWIVSNLDLVPKVTKVWYDGSWNHQNYELT